jgi:transcription elongation factor Elf1
MMADNVISLEAHKSAREPLRRIFRCIACDSYQFKLIEVDGEDHISCANCEAWINEFNLVRTREDI